MVLITRRILAQSAADRWRSTYYRFSQWQRIFGAFTSQEVYEHLAALGDHPDPDEVDRLIGNDTWTRVTCQLCDVSDRPERAVRVNDDSGRTIQLCPQHLLDLLDCCLKEEHA